MEMDKRSFPEGWKVVRLGEVCEKIIGGGTPLTKNEEYWNGDIPWISSADIHGIRDVRPRKSINEKAIENSTTNLVPKGSIIVVTRVGLGKLAIAPCDLCFSQDNQGLVLKENLIRTDYALLVLHQEVQNFLHQSRGTTINGVTKKQLVELPLALPPLAEQEQIVARIEALFSELDAGKQEAEKALAQLKVYRQAVLKWAFEGRLTNEHVVDGELPEGWELTKLRELGTWKGGGTPSKAHKDFWEGGTILWVSPKDMKSMRIIDTIDKITPAAVDGSSANLIPKGSVLFVVRSGILRRTLPIALTMSEVTVNQDMQAFTPKEISPEYVYWFAAAANDTIRNTCSKDGTTVESIDTASLKDYEIPVCSFEEQHRIVQEIEARLSVCDEIERTLAQSLQQAEALRQSILKKAFEGKLL